jgi:hypothetical protein
MGREGTIHTPALLADLFGISRSEARRVLAQGGVTVRVPGAGLQTEERLDVPTDQLAGHMVWIGTCRCAQVPDDPDAICEECKALVTSQTHRLACPVGRGLERFNVVNALGRTVGHEWLSPQMAAEVRRDIANR